MAHDRNRQAAAPTFELVFNHPFVLGDAAEFDAILFKESVKPSASLGAAEQT